LAAALVKALKWVAESKRNIAIAPSKLITIMVFKFLATLIEWFYWVLLLLCPFLIIGVLGLFLGMQIDYRIFYASLPIGFVLGVLFANYVKRKYGTSNFYGRLLRMPELDKPNSNEKI
jgi:hypothetical protein